MLSIYGNFPFWQKKKSTEKKRLNRLRFTTQAVQDTKTFGGSIIH
jgi:hypothetical protein